MRPTGTFPAFIVATNRIKIMPEEATNLITGTDPAEINLEASKAHAEAAGDTAKTAAQDIYSSTKGKAEAAIGKGKEQLSKAAQDLSDAGKAKYEDLKAKATVKGEEYKGKAQDALGEAQAKAKVIQSDSEQYIRDNPLQAVGIALGVGFVLGIVLRK